MSPAFEIKNLSFAYKNKVLFRNLNLIHQASEINLWVGASGVGKSTLAQIICSHQMADSGLLKVFGQQPNRASLERLYIPHENDLFTWHTFQRHIDFLKSELGADFFASSDEILKLADLLQVANLFHKYPNELSMGQVRRFQILRSFVLNSKLIFFDETFSAIDSELMNHFLPPLYDLWKLNKKNIVIISHQPAASFNISFSQIVDFNQFFKGP